ncbi:MAG: dTMP kinase [Caldimicrobium sp.]
MFLKSPRKALILYGNPGVGKTSLIEYLFHYLSKLNLTYEISGFITKELRENNERIGFDLIYLKDTSFRLPLARRKDLVGYSQRKSPSVGKYIVFVENLNKFVEILERDLTASKERSIVFIDEIGKMESYSEKFINLLENIWEEHLLVASLGKGDYPLLREWAKKKDTLYVEVTFENRDFLKSRLEVEFSRKGKLFVFEGIDGVGKTTIFNKLREDKAFSHFLFSFEPTLGFYGQKIRNLLLNKKATSSELLDLFLKDRQEHVEKVILPALIKGKVLILDRYYLSTLAYQGDEETLLELLKKNETFSPMPDLVLYFELSPEEAIKRITQRGDKKSLFEKEDSLRKIAKNYYKILSLFNYITIPAWKSVETLYEEVRVLLEEFLRGET